MKRLHKQCPTIVDLIEKGTPDLGLEYVIDKVFIKTMNENRPDMEVTRFEETATNFIVSKNVLNTIKTIDIKKAKGHMSSSDLTGTRFNFILGNDIDGLLCVEIVSIELKATDNKKSENSVLAFYTHSSGNGTVNALTDAPVGYADLVSNSTTLITKHKDDVPEQDYGMLTMQLLLYMHFGDIISKHYLPNENIKISPTSSIKNDLKVPVTYLNTLWKQRVTTGGFKVNGHWRMQVCGKKRAQRRLIWIEAFAKTGYNRKATKELHYE